MRIAFYFHFLVMLRGQIAFCHTKAKSARTQKYLVLNWSKAFGQTLHQALLGSNQLERSGFGDSYIVGVPGQYREDWVLLK